MRTVVINIRSASRSTTSCTVSCTISRLPGRFTQIIRVTDLSSLNFLSRSHRQPQPRDLLLPSRILGSSIACATVGCATTGMSFSRIAPGLAMQWPLPLMIVISVTITIWYVSGRRPRYDDVCAGGALRPWFGCD